MKPFARTEMPLAGLLKGVLVSRERLKLGSFARRIGLGPSGLGSFSKGVVRSLSKQSRYERNDSARAEHHVPSFTSSTS